VVNLSASPSTNTVQDKAKLAVAGVIVVAAVVAFYVLANNALVLRLGIVLAAVAIALAIGWTTQIGKDFFTYCQDSVTETKKVVWPSRKETFQTTGIVVLFVLIMAVFLWIVDASLVYLVRILVGREA
jgi:preprotein translocase subunit SecE